MDFESVINSLIALDFEALYTSITFEIALVAMVCLIITAFFSLRIFNIYISAFCSLTLGSAGHYVALLLLDEGIIPVIEGIRLEMAIGLAAAILGFILAAFIHKIALFLSGGCVAFSIMYVVVMPILVPSVFQLEEPVPLIISIVVAGIVGILVAVLFKPLYIFVTSLGGMAGVGALVALSLLPKFDLTFLIIGLVAGAIIGIIPMIHQFKKNAEEA